MKGQTDRRTDGHINGKMQQNFVLEIMPGRWMINPEHELVIVVFVFSFIYLFFFADNKNDQELEYGE